MGTDSKHLVYAWTRPQAHQGEGALSNPGYAGRVTYKAHPPPCLDQNERISMG